MHGSKGVTNINLFKSYYQKEWWSVVSSKIVLSGEKNKVQDNVYRITPLVQIL